MLTAILLQNPKLRDAVVSLVSGVKQTNQTENILFYQKGSMIFAFSETLSLREIFEKTLQEYQPERMFILESGYSIDMAHEIGDIILPNVFLEYNKNLEKEEITKENHDTLMGEVKFLEIFDEQKDFYIENFGLSIGGIIVSNAPNCGENCEKLMAVYEADAYVQNFLYEAYEIIGENLVATVLLVGIVEGKKPKNFANSSFSFVAENFLTTIRMLEQEENESED